MLGHSSSGFGGSSVDAVAGEASTAHDAAAAPSSSAEEERGNFGGNRWPRQETLALLKIRSDMDVAFRDASVKGPLWDEVSRKLAELGYHRSAKKCREKFENVYKYHKRTKEGRSGKPDGKTYRFFDQLQALENQPPSFHKTPAPAQLLLLPPPNKPHEEPPPTAAAPSNIPQNITVKSTSTPYNINPIPISQTINQIPAPPQLISSISLPPNPININPNFQQPAYNINPSASNFPANISSSDLFFNSTSSSSSSSSSEEEVLEGSRKRRKRKWKEFFERLMTEVIHKQEELQKRFLEAIEKREHERIAREEAWRMQEMAKLNREREILAQERSMAAAKDAAVMAFLQKISDQQQNPVRDDPPLPQPSIPLPQPQVQSTLAVLPSQTPPAPPPTAATSAQQIMVIPETEDHNNENYNRPITSTSSRWPKVEVQALIELRSSLDAKYQENGPKGPLWEEISAAMKKLGYNRNAKRCKEKWENINKYFKKVKESNKKRPEDSKTCPYFHQLDALYKEKNKLEISGSMAMPLMVRPEQQWPPQQGADQTRPESAGGNIEDMEREPLMDQRQEDDDDDDDDEATDVNDEEEENENGGNYEIVASRPASNQ